MFSGNSFLLKGQAVLTMKRQYPTTEQTHMMNKTKDGQLMESLETLRTWINSHFELGMLSWRTVKTFLYEFFMTNTQYDLKLHS